MRKRSVGRPRIQGFAIILCPLSPARRWTKERNAEEISLRAERMATEIMMLAFSDWWINNGRKHIVHRPSRPILPKKKKKNEWLSRFYWAEHARKSCERISRRYRSTISQKTDSQPFDIGHYIYVCVYIYSWNRCPSCHRQRYSLCCLINVINNSGNARVLCTDSSPIEFIALVLYISSRLFCGGWIGFQIKSLVIETFPS